MLPTPLVTVSWLAEHLHDPDLRVLDCRFDLMDPGAGLAEYREAHVPGAVYAHLESDLSGPKRPGGAGGRHPLPEPGVLAARLGALGVGDGHRVVVYDDPRGGRGMSAARAWWLLRWLGHADVAVLDGGWAAWQASGAPVETRMDEEGRAAPATFTPRVRPELVADAEEVAALPDSVVLVDSRAAARYAGEVEPLDPKAGHIPGARNVDWSGALDANGYFLPPERQRERLAVTEGRDAVLYCGSGVSAAVNLLALELAGRPLGASSRLYAGSWSDWVSGEGTRPVATGREDGTPGTGP